MERRQTRKILTIDRVDAETFTLVEKAVTNGIAHTGVSVLLLNGKHYVAQHAEALLVKDLLKVESLPVADNLTTQRTPGEVAISADAQGLDLVAEDLMSDAPQARREYTKLQQVAWMDLWWTPGTFKGVGRTRAGVEIHDVNTINLKQAVPQSWKDRLQTLTGSLDDVLTLKSPIVIGNFDDTGNPIMRAGKRGDRVQEAIMVHPLILEAFAGSADEKLSVQTLTRNLLWCVANDEPDEATRYLMRLRGVLETVAASTKVAKQRINRGNKAVSARRRAGYIPSGWIAVAYNGNLVRQLARTAGWTKDLGVHPGDFMAGKCTVAYRSPQPQPTPQRVWVADCPENKVQGFKDAGNWPDDAVRFGIRTGQKLEPDTFVQSPLATASDGGDLDGDQVAATVLRSEDASNQLLAYDWRAARERVFTFYMGKPEDPAVWAYEHDPAKLKWATTKLTTVRELIGLTAESIRNQTLHIGIAHGYAHKTLAVADLMGGDVWLAAQGLMFGHYEEQLAGLNAKYYRFYETLARKRSMGGPDWEATLAGITQELNHSNRDWATMKRANWLVTCYQYINKNQCLHVLETPELVNGSTYHVKPMAQVVAAGVYCALSKGDLGSAFLRWAANPNIAASLDLQAQALGRVSLVHKLINAYFTETHREVNHMAFPNAVEEF